MSTIIECLLCKWNSMEDNCHMISITCLRWGLNLPSQHISYKANLWSNI